MTPLRFLQRVTSGLAALSVIVMLPAIARASAITFSGAGADPAAIQAIVDSYRAALGTLNPNVAGSFGSGRREINWDGVPDALAAPNNLPANFFNTNSPRGAVFSTPGTGFEVSANAAGLAPIEFGDINPTYPGTFETFSPQRLFTALGSNIVDVNFFVPGSSTPATVGGFGSVFTDVDLLGATSLEFFAANGASLGLFTASTANDGLSFLGVLFNAGERVGRVRIRSGNSALGPNDAPGTDVVGMDDFIYAEPTAVAAVPEPVSLLNVGASLVFFFVLKRVSPRLGNASMPRREC